MKHNLKITIILIVMFILTQLIGLFVISQYQIPSNPLPFGQPPADINENFSLISIVFSFIIAIGIFFLLTKIRAESFIKIWFFIVTILALSLTINALFFKFSLMNALIASLIISIPLAYFKIYKRKMLIHNITELLIYPGIAAVFVPILGVVGIIILLLIISLYDIWAVWHSGFMQKMAKFQIDNLKIFTGFFLPYADKKTKSKIKLIKEKYQNKSDNFLEKKFKESKIKVHLAILGGGDVVFPIITAGIFYKVYNSVFPSLIITLFATLGLLYLFVFAKKGKFYPAMPFLTIAMYLGMIVTWILMYLKVF